MRPPLRRSDAAVLCGLALLTPGGLRAQPAEPASPGAALAVDARSLAAGAAAFATAPGRWGPREWALLGLAGGAVGLVIAGDEGVRRAVLDHRTPALHHLSAALRGGGDPLGWGGAAVAAVYVGGLAADGPTLRATGLEMAEAVLLSGVVAGGLKLAVGRSRPSEDRGAVTVHPLGGGIGGGRSSFPSEHATLAFAAASVASQRAAWVGWVAYPLASLVALSRVYDDRHWLSDATAGALLGAATGYWVTQRGREATPSSGVRIVPGPVGTGVGLCAAGRF